MDKLDLKKIDKAFYSGPREGWALIEVPHAQYLWVEGKGDPSGPDYEAAMKRLYPVAYGVKFAAKSAGRDFAVPPQSTLWWADDPQAFVEGRRAEWRWRAMLRMPDFVTVGDVAQAATVKGVTGVGFDPLDEGTCFQALHIGPYTAEAPRLAQLHDEVMPRAGVTFNGHHHEIYLSDPRKTAPEKLRTILRQPVRAA